MAKTFKYPASLETDKFNHIAFYQRDKDKKLKNVFTFYVPQEYMVGDSASWSDTELGMFKGLVDRMSKATTGESTLGETIKSELESFKNDKNANVILANTLGEGTVVGTVAEGIMRNRGLAINPNLVLMYRGNGIRQFQFMFRMIASNEKEARDIEEIAHEFRAGSYGSKNENFLLDYPDQFKFVYLTPGGGINDFLPAPATLVLNSVSMSNNPSTNLFHSRGAPVEVTLALMFREIRALNRDDIEKLRNETQLQGGNVDYLRDDSTWLV
jgi:hypothetical protein